ncbi:MAG TPA: MBL fold metallo-hydrolase [Geminicoccus sp.]|jgi:phosphoribosyl 1,2-cyclic phosphate phosphodiesterase|uniref:MBL fold metallo-hydrolase n=1 Tax=Geminicoccus sp. TaxID=2024832 RepID=UPI002E338F08|nr:MBL fold metallo-hydrolase [Geminicoccus sp.]HEX2525926.1 MBL fold metallo-hydrolase [Geminicoccus sp.]
MRITVLGCGTSSGVPQIGCHCPVCLSDDPKNKRLRSSILVEREGTAILFDCGPDMRTQLLAADVGRLDALVFTHAHADHTHGIDDVRGINNSMDAVLPAYGDALVLEQIRARFDYAFHPDRHPSGGFWRPSLDPRPFDGPFEVGALTLVPFRQRHGRTDSWGFRIGNFAYSTDADWLDEQAFATLAGIRWWIVDCLRERPHPTHAHLDRTLAWIERVRPERTWLTHMNHEVDYDSWCRKLPAHVRPAYDGLVIDTERP